MKFFLVWHCETKKYNGKYIRIYLKSAVSVSFKIEKYTKKQMTKFVTELIIGIFAKDSASPQGLVGDIWIQ